MIAIESPLQIVRSVGAQSENGCQANKPTDSYVEFEFVFPDMVYALNSDLDDHEVLLLAGNSGSFAFLDSPEEDIYNDLIKKQKA
jgi:hypothetical protein